jgi:hypothetical protein
MDDSIMNLSKGFQTQVLSYEAVQDMANIYVLRQISQGYEIRRYSVINRSIQFTTAQAIRWSHYHYYIVYRCLTSCVEASYVEYLHRSPASRKCDEKGRRCLG